MKVSIFTVSTPEYDVDETVAFAKEIGCDGLEWRVSEPAPAEKPKDYTFEKRYWSYNRSTIDVNRVESGLPEAVEKTRAAGLEVLGATTYLRMSEAPLADIKRVLSAAHSSGVRYIRTPVPGYDRTRHHDEIIAETRRAIEQTIPHAKEAGVRLCFEMHMNTPIASASAVRRLLDGLDPGVVGVIYDPGNLVIEGFEDYQMGLEILGEYLAYVHVKNTLWARDPNAHGHPWQWQWAPMTKGMADFRDIMGCLRRIGYDGWLSVEDFSNEEPTKEKLTGIVNHLRKLIAESESGDAR
jgi:sugar phosphate isomerase/epimerase